MRIHFGKTEHPGWLRFWRGTIKMRNRLDQQCYFEHPIRSMFGISFARSFFGVIKTDGTQDVRATGDKRSSFK